MVFGSLYVPSTADPKDLLGVADVKREAFGMDWKSRPERDADRPIIRKD